jgi:DNA-directed RNA polymerase omega subunit
MSDSNKNFPAIDPPRATRARARGGRYEPEIYVEDITAIIPNKYLAVNVAAQRARVLNDRDLPVGEAAKQAKKPTTQALLELIDGRLTYEVQLPRSEDTDAEEEFGEETDEGVAALFDEYADDDTSSAADDAAPFDEDA